MRPQSLVAMLVMALLLPLLPGAALAQETTPGGDASAMAGVEVVRLAEADIGDPPPAPAFAGLARFTFPPDAATPAGADPGSVLAFVESGSFVATVDGPATITRAADAGTPAAVPEASEARLQPGDAVFVPAGTASSFRNDGQEEATLLGVMIFPEDPFGRLSQIDLDGVAVELLVGGMLDTIPSSPAAVTLARQTFEPGGGFEPSSSPGPVLGLVESGQLTYTLADGESAITRGADTVGSGRRSSEAAEVGSDVDLAPDDAFVAEGGASSGSRNAGDAPAELLVVFLWSTDAVG